MQRFVLWFFALFMGGAIALTPAFLVVLYREAPPVSYGRREIASPVVPPGGSLVIEIAADIQKPCDAVVYRTIVDGTGFPWELGPEARPQKTNYQVEVPIPLGAAPGPSYYVARIEWRCNFVQDWFPKEVIQRQLPFTIAPLEGQIPIPQQQGVYTKPLQKSEIARAP